MLRIFQNIRPISSVFVLLAGLLIRLPLLLNGNPSEQTLHYHVLEGFFTSVNSHFYLSVIGGLVIVFLQSILFNRICIEHDVIYVHSYLPAYFFMLLNSVFPANLFINPIMIVNFFVLFSFFSMYQMYRMENTSVILFYSAIFYGSASLFLPIVYTGFFFLIIATIIFKNITVKDLLSIISGYALPALMLGGILFIAGYEYVIPRVRISLDLNVTIAPERHITVIYILLLTAAGLVKTTLNYTKNNIKTRRINLFMAGNFIFFLAIMLLHLKEYAVYFPLITFAVAMQLAYFMLGSKGRRLKGFLHYVLLGAIVFSLYGQQFLALK